MSQGRASQSPAGPSRLPVYLTGAPLLSSSPPSNMRSPRVSASNRNGIKRSSAFESFDAPAYCNDMAQFIAAQLSAKPRRISRREQELASAAIGDRWRGSSLKGKHTELADVSVQTVVEEGDSIIGASRAMKEDIDIARTEKKKAEADAFLQRLAAHSDDPIEVERDVEGQVLSFFGAEIPEQPSDAEADGSVDSSEDLPEVNSHIAGLLAEKSKCTGPLIEEVEPVAHGGSAGDSSSSGDDEGGDQSESAEDEGFEEVEMDSDDEERRVLSYEERRDALMRADTFADQAYSRRSNEHNNDYNGLDLYEDSMSAQPRKASSEPIELSDSDEDEAEEDVRDGRLVEEDREEVEIDELDTFDSGLDVSAPRLDDEAGDYDEALLTSADEAARERESTSNYLHPEPMLDTDDGWTNERQMDLMMMQSDVGEQSNPVDLPHEVETAAIANMFEQPGTEFTVKEYSDRSSSLNDMQGDKASPKELPQFAIDTFVDGAALDEDAEEAPAPPISPHLQQAGDGADLLSLKQRLTTNDPDTSQAASLSAQPGSPPRAESYEQPRQANDGHARDAKELLLIKSKLQGASDAKNSLATSLASDIDSAPHHSDIGSVGNPRKSSLEDCRAANSETVLSDAVEAEERNFDALSDQQKTQDITMSSLKAQQDLEDELVDFIEVTERGSSFERGDDLDIQSFNGSYSSEHVYGREEGGSIADPSEVLITITEEEEEEKGGEEEDERDPRSDADRPEEDQQEQEQIEAEHSSEGSEGAGEGDPEVIEPLSASSMVTIDPLPEDEVLQGSVETVDEGATLEVETAAERTGEGTDSANLPAVVEIIAEPVEATEEHIDEPDDELVANTSYDQHELKSDIRRDEENTLTVEQDAEEEDKSTVATPRRSERARTRTVEPSSPTITRQSLRKSQSRAPSEAPVSIEQEGQPESPLKAPSKAKRERKARASTVESASKATKMSRKSAPRAASVAASEGSPRKHRHRHRKSDADGDLADFVPEVEEDQENDEANRPTKRHRAEKEGDKDDMAQDALAPDADEEMLDTSILEEEEEPQMQVDEVAAAEGDAMPVEDTLEPPKPPRSARKSKSAPRKSYDPTFRVQRVEESDSDEDKETKAKKEEQVKKRREADREHRRELREAKRQEKEIEKKEEKEAEKAAAGQSRKSRISEDVKSFRPKAVEDEQEEEEMIPSADTIAKRRRKRKAV